VSARRDGRVLGVRLGHPAQAGPGNVGRDRSSDIFSLRGWRQGRTRRDLAKRTSRSTARPASRVSIAAFVTGPSPPPGRRCSTAPSPSARRQRRGRGRRKTGGPRQVACVFRAIRTPGATSPRGSCRITRRAGLACRARVPHPREVRRRSREWARRYRFRSGHPCSWIALIHRRQGVVERRGERPPLPVADEPRAGERRGGTHVPILRRCVGAVARQGPRKATIASSACAAAQTPNRMPIDP
jgi:hypothetical protein